MVESSTQLSTSARREQFVSCAFWTLFLISSVLYTVLALGPGLAAQLKLRERFARNAVDSQRVQAEIDHLTKLAAALDSDPEFIQRLANEEFRPASATETRIPVALSLNFDARVPAVAESTSHEDRPPGRLFALILAASERSSLRRQLELVLLVMVLFGFVCLNEEFLTSRTGGYVRGGLVWLVSRYRLEGRHIPEDLHSAKDV